MMHGKKITHNWMIWLTIFVLFCIAVYVLRSVLLPFVAGIVIGYLLDPWASKFEKWGMSRTCATVLVMFLVVIIAVPAVLMLFGIIDEQLGQFIRAVPNYLASFARKNRTGYKRAPATDTEFGTGTNSRLYSQQYGKQSEVGGECYAQRHYQRICPD